jgi:hypothetical protein
MDKGKKWKSSSWRTETCHQLSMKPHFLLTEFRTPTMATRRLSFDVLAHSFRRASDMHNYYVRRAPFILSICSRTASPYFVIAVPGPLHWMWSTATCYAVSAVMREAKKFSAVRTACRASRSATSPGLNAATVRTFLIHGSMRVIVVRSRRFPYFVHVWLYHSLSKKSTDWPQYYYWSR